MNTPGAPYNNLATYGFGETVTADSVVYTSLVGLNTGHVPGFSPTFWSAAGAPNAYAATHPAPYSAGAPGPYVAVGPPYPSTGPVTPATQAVLNMLPNPGNLSTTSHPGAYPNTVPAPPAATYSAVTTYGSGQIVSYNGVNYQSLVANNFAHTPGVSPTFWSVAPPGSYPNSVFDPNHSQGLAMQTDIVNLKRDMAQMKAEHTGIWRALGANTRVV